MLKVMIVEDEAGVRNGIIDAFYWQDFGCEVCGAASDGLEAMEMCLKTQPDLVITDIVMPGLDGLAFLKYIKERYPAIRFIILTGHREFDYAKNAVNFGADAFMLKPVQFDGLRQAIEKICNELRQQNDDHRRQYAIEKLVQNLLEGRVCNRQGLDLEAKLFLDQLRFNYCVAIIELDNEKDAHPMLLQSVLSLCNGMNAEDKIVFIKTSPYQITAIVPVDSSQKVWEDQRRYWSVIQARIQELLGITVSIGVSQQRKTEENMHTGYLECNSALSNRFFTGGNSLHFYSEISQSTQVEPDYYLIIRVGHKLADMLTHAEGVSLNQKSSALFRQVVKELGKDVPLIKSSVILILSLATKQVFHQDTRQMSWFFEHHYNFRAAVCCEEMDMLESTFVAIVADLSDYVTVKKNKNKQIIIDKVFSYIQDNYATNITLNDIARQVYFSPSYLSTFITNMTGKSFVEILTETRVEAAIALLKDDTQKSSVIAHRVGFRQPQYFSQAFKKITGMTPSEYRKSIHK